MAHAPPNPPADRFQELRTQIRGQLIVPGSAEYDPARKLWNGLIDKRPAVIARCRDETDVSACVKYARQHKMPLAVRGGGHSVAGASTVDDGLVIDLSEMRAVHVDSASGTVWVQGGALWGDVDHATQFHGLVVPGGFVSTTGVGGFTLGGGIAWTSRKLGLACDALVSAEVVTAEGELRTASAHENADLLWALRGAGGNFGVVTSMTFRAQPLGPIVYGGFRIFPASQARRVVRLVADLYDRTPEEFNALVVLTTAPPAPFIPPAVHGAEVAVVAFCYLGPPEHGPKVCEELLAIPEPIFEQVGPLPYVALQAAFDPLNPPGLLNYWKSLTADGLPEAALDVLLGLRAKAPSPLTELHFQYFGGAASRVAGQDSPTANRGARFLYNLIGKWTDPATTAANTAFIRDAWQALRPHSTGGIYVNFLTDRSPELARSTYGPEGHARLVEIKRRYDPENLFRGTLNIPPG